MRNDISVYWFKISVFRKSDNLDRSQSFHFEVFIHDDAST